MLVVLCLVLKYFKNVFLNCGMENKGYRFYCMKIWKGTNCKLKGRTNFNGIRIGCSTAVGCSTATPFSTFVKALWKSWISPFLHFVHSISAYIRATKVSNVREPLAIDVSQPWDQWAGLGPACCDFVIIINLLHMTEQSLEVWHMY